MTRLPGGVRQGRRECGAARLDRLPLRRHERQHLLRLQHIHRGQAQGDSEVRQHCQPVGRADLDVAGHFAPLGHCRPLLGLAYREELRFNGELTTTASLLICLASVASTSLFQGLSHIIEMTYGIVFQEFSLGERKGKINIFVLLRMTWVFATMLLTMAFLSNLKSSLVKKNFEKRTETFDEIMEKDMLIHTPQITMNFYKSLGDNIDVISKKVMLQAEKKKSIYVRRCEFIFKKNNVSCFKVRTFFFKSLWRPWL